MANEWSAVTYAENARFVSDLTAEVFALLDPQPGERILDIGCGDGVLSLKIVEAGASVLGIDSSDSMLAAAAERGISVQRLDARSLPFSREFDAVFSNAALHWIPEASLVAEGVARALKPGGRFVAEFGGFGNIAAISVAMRAVCARYGVRSDERFPKFYPTPAEYASLLQSHGFTVESIGLYPRPTPLPTGMEGWLRTFGKGLLSLLPDADSAVAEAVELLRPNLCDEAGNWIADYVRLRVLARWNEPRLATE